MGLRLLLLVAAQAVAVAPAAAQEPSDEAALTDEQVQRARSHFMAGSAYYEDGRYEDAAREFREAYRITAHPDVLYNLAQSYDRLDRRQEAVDAYRGYLEGSEDAPDRGRVERRIGEIEELIAAAERESGPPVSAEPTPAGPAQPSEEGGVGLLPWIALGVAGAMAVGAAVTGAMALSIHEDLEDDCDASKVCPPDRRDDIDTGSALAIWSTVLTVGAALAAGAGVTLLVLGGSREAAPTTARLELTPGPAPLGAGARLRF